MQVQDVRRYASYEGAADERLAFKHRGHLGVACLGTGCHFGAAWLDTGCHLAPVICCERRELLWPMQKALSWASQAYNKVPIPLVCRDGDLSRS